MSLQTLFPSLPAALPVVDGTLSTSDDFEVLGLALSAAGLDEAVGEQPSLTLFAPTDDAFAGLAQSLGYEGDPDDAEAVFGSIAGSLADLSPDDDPIPLLTDILLYHVSPETTELDELNSDGPIPTLLEGAEFEVTGGTVVDGDPDYVNADVISPDVDVPNGVIQVVDQVLLPIDAPVSSDAPTLLGLLEESGGSFDANSEDFDMLLTALQATGLDEAVDDPDADLTVFVPNDAAFIGLAQDLGYDGDDEGEAFQTILDAAALVDPENPTQVVTDILLYHVSPGEQSSEDVLGSDSLATLQGADIGVMGTTLVDQDPNAVDPNIVATDIEASNGVAHAVDAILRPVDLPPTAESEDTSDNDDDDDDYEWWEIALGVWLIGSLAFGFAFI